MTLVIDASVTLAWIFADERTPQTTAIEEGVRTDGAVVPSLWALEVANILLQAEKRGRIGSADAAARLELLRALPIFVDSLSLDVAWRAVAPLARAEKLTAYDAAYLELAIRRGLPLATLDRELRIAAKRRGVVALRCACAMDSCRHGA